MCSFPLPPCLTYFCVSDCLFIFTTSFSSQLQFMPKWRSETILRAWNLNPPAPGHSLVWFSFGVYWPLRIWHLRWHALNSASFFFLCLGKTHQFFLGWQDDMMMCWEGCTAVRIRFRRVIIKRMTEVFFCDPQHTDNMKCCCNNCTHFKESLRWQHKFKTHN